MAKSRANVRPEQPTITSWDPHDSQLGCLRGPAVKDGDATFLFGSGFLWGFTSENDSERTTGCEARGKTVGGGVSGNGGKLVGRPSMGDDEVSNHCFKLVMNLKARLPGAFLFGLTMTVSGTEAIRPGRWHAKLSWHSGGAFGCDPRGCYTSPARCLS